MADEKENGKSPPAARPVNVAVSTLARAHLECTAGPDKGKTLRVAPGTTIIGRDPGCDIVLSETAVSRHHCRIERRAEQWHLRNLSSNGTLLNKKPADDVALADGDEIRIGVKTRLRFVVEAVALSTTGRPQFRRRTGAQEETEAGDEAAEAPQEARPSLFQRRKGVFVGLGVYLAAMVILAAVVGYYKIIGPDKVGSGDVPIMGEDDAVRPEPGARPLLIVKEDGQGIWVQDLAGPRLIPKADLESGKAVRVGGIRQAIDVKFLEAKKAPPGYLYTISDVNPAVGKQCVDQALELYRVRNLPDRDPALFGSVRLFQQALAYNGGRGYFEDSSVDRVYRQALKDLIQTICRLYGNAVGPEEKTEPRRALETYNRILNMLPDTNNPIFINVSYRKAQLKRSMPDAK